MRSFSNLLERLHHSFWFYILLLPGKCLLLSTYIAPVILLSAVLVLHGLKYWWASDLTPPLPKPAPKKGYKAKAPGKDNHAEASGKDNHAEAPGKDNHEESMIKNKNVEENVLDKDTTRRLNGLWNKKATRYYCMPPGYERFSRESRRFSVPLVVFALAKAVGILLFYSMASFLVCFPGHTHDFTRVVILVWNWVHCRVSRAVPVCLASRDSPCRVSNEAGSGCRAG